MLLLAVLSKGGLRRMIQTATLGAVNKLPLGLLHIEFVAMLARAPQFLVIRAD